MADQQTTRTHDRGRYYTVNDLGAKRSTTPEGFLVCHDVPIARTGTQLYTAAEAPIEPGPDGLIRIDRPAEEVFRDETVRSFEGKPVTVEHPNDFVTPANWSQVSVGFTQNVRRGDGINDDLILADLVITDQAAIQYVNESLPEVSAGYEAVYQQTEPGRGVQRDIVGNHVALVERGRAGPRCSIQDKEPTMSKKTTTKRTWMDRLRTAFKAQDEAAMEEALEEAKDSDSDDEDEDDGKAKTGDAAAIKALTSAVTKLTADVAKLSKLVKDADKPDDEDDDGKNTGDEVLDPEPAGHNGEAKGKVLSGDTLKSVVTKAEILAPGINVPTGDSAGADQVENLQRKALITCIQGSESGRQAVSTFSQGRDISKLTGDALAAVFHGAAELVRVRNNDAAKPRVNTKDFGKTTSIEDINARNREYWSKAR